MNADPRQEELVDEIGREREELVTAVARVRGDVHRDVAHLRETAKRQLPKVAAAFVVAVAAITVPRLMRARGPRRPIPIVRLRVGRYTLIEQR
jgi:hypothetical protein